MEILELKKIIRKVIAQEIMRQNGFDSNKDSYNIVENTGNSHDITINNSSFQLDYDPLVEQLLEWFEIKFKV